MKKKESISIFKKQSIAVVPYLTLSERIERIKQGMASLCRAFEKFNSAVECQTKLLDEITFKISWALIDEKRAHATKKTAGD